MKPSKKSRLPLRLTASLMAALLMMTVLFPTAAFATVGSRETSLSQMMYAEYGSEVCATVYADGYVRRIAADATTVGELLEAGGIQIGAQDITEPALSAPVSNNMAITVTRVTTSTVTSTEVIPYSQIRRPSEYITKGTEQLERAGVNGSKLVTYEIIYKDGVESSRRVISEDVVSEPVDEIVVYGCGGTVTTPSGEQLSFVRKIDGEATAYTCEGQSWNTTFTGTTARVGAIAVDPKYIPLGTVVYISSPDGESWVYGTARAEDTGGAIKGHIIDLYMNTYRECINFGRRSCSIYILETN